jgi:hypothetical protein
VRQTRQRRPATARHPIDGAALWFNQAHLFHPASLPSDARATLLESFSADRLPRTALYGDGRRIGDEVVGEILAVYEELSVDVCWSPGDVLVLDNMRWAHGRRPFEGERALFVAMAERSSAGGEA